MPRSTIGVAIAIPEPWRSALRDWRERLGDPAATAIPPHVTLLPPTTLAPGARAGVEAHLDEVAEVFRPFRLHLRGSATFRPVSPVVFVQLAQGMAECALLERGVRSGPLGREVGFAYYPHVTVAHELGEDVLDRAYADLVDFDASFEVPGFSLFERDKDGCWRALREFAFPAPPTPSR